MAETVRYSTQAKARRIALDALYAAKLRGQGIVETFIEAKDLTAITVRGLTMGIVHGMAKRQEEVDVRIPVALDKSQTLERMPAVDHNLAGTMIFEMGHTDTPGPVVIAKAVRLAQELSTDGSPDFLNGLFSEALSIKETNS